MKLTATSAFSVFIYLFFIFLSHSAFPSNTNALVKIVEPKTPTVSKEKIYIHFDKTFYNSGESIWYKIYLVDAIYHESETLSKVIYVDLIDPNNIIIDSKTIKVNEGSGKGDFKLPVDIIDGAYTVRAYTNFMRNFDDSYFFRKKIHVNYSKSNNASKIETMPVKPHISFFPEGGNIVSGFVNSIVFKAINEEGKGVNISGSILDETNKTIRTFKASKLGHGIFQFIPQKGKQYKATILYKEEKYTYELPSIIDHGVLMRVNESINFFRVNIYSSLPNKNNNLKLIGLQKGDIVCHTELSGGKSEIAINVPKSDLKPGLIEFNLLNKNDVVLSKELAFSDSNNSNQNATIKTSKSVYDKNEIVEVDITLSDLTQKNEIANMSITVTEALPFKKATYASDIKTHLYLTSELLENIEQTSYYLHSNDSQRKNNLNILLRSQDVNQDLFKEDPKSNTLKFSLESGFNLKGTIKEKRNKKPVKAGVTISYKNGKDFGYDKTITDSLGRFNFNNLNFDERTFVSIKAKSLNSKKYGKDFTIELDSVIPPRVNTKLVTEKNTDKDNTLIKPKIKENRNTEFAPQKGEVKLDQVKITAKKKRLDRFAKKRSLSLYTRPSHTLDFKDLRVSPSARNPIQALQGLFPGVHVIGDNITLRGRNSLVGNNEPLFLLDGFPSDLDMITSIPIFDIDFIDIIQSNGASIYGVRGGGGVIAVYTLDGTEQAEEENDRNGTISFYHPGYYQARSFNKNKDNSSTLYWNPDLKLEQSNKSKIVFKTANKSATYMVLLEGITSKGIPFKTEAFFDVK